MNIRDIIEGYVTLKFLQRKGFVEDDKLGFGAFIKLVTGAEKNILNENKGVGKDEDKQG